MVCGRISCEYWSRFKSYARHVRILECHDTFRTVHPSVFYLLRERNGNQPFLPALISLDWYQQYLAIGSDIFLALSGSLRKVVLRYSAKDALQKQRAKTSLGEWEHGCGEWDNVVGNALISLSSHAPHLQRFYLNASLHPHALDLSGFRNLQRLELCVPFVTRSIVLACMQMEHLTHSTVQTFLGVRTLAFRLASAR